jgi:hypothetical protein
MRIRPFLPPLAAGLLAVAAASQTYQTAGFYFNVATSANLTNSSPTSPTRMLARISNADYRDWGVHSDFPTKHDIRGVSLVVQDSDGSTGEVFTIQGFGENPAAPTLPDPADNFLNSANITIPPGAPGVAAWLYNLTFATPALADIGEDVFLGIGQPAIVAPANGLGVHCVLGAVVGTFAVYDLPGAGMPATPPSYAVSWTGTAAPGHVTTKVQLRVDPFLDEMSGVATAVTNQTSFVISNTPPGTASFFSGLHPDAASPPKNAGRADDVGFRVEDADLAGQPIIFFIDADFSATPAGLFLPGAASRGTFCGNAALLMTMGVGVGSTPSGTADPFGGRAAFNVSLPPAVRVGLQGVNVVWWALGLKLPAGDLYGSPCAKQRL